MALQAAKTKYGMVSGVALESGISVFRGIPYAKADRFMPPQEPDSWEGTKVCDTFSPIFPQIQPAPGNPFSEFFIKEFYPEHKPMSEDAFCVNVWTSAAAADEKMPVMVWFHGGGMGAGYGHEQEFDGEAIAKRGVILVTVNYRVNIFGYFSHPEIAKRTADGVGGNNAIRDQQAALRWVQENIAQFGGDPGNVTIFGQSAGGGSVVSHIFSPMSDGLFHKGIIQSGLGGITSYGKKTMEDQYEWAQKACEILGKTVDEIIQMPVEELLEAYAVLEKELGQIPKQTKDGYIFPDSPGANILNGSPRNDVKLMIGNVNGDTGGMPIPGKDAVETELIRRYGDRADEFLAKYPREDEKNAGIYKALMDSIPWFDSLYFCISQTSRDNFAYMYYFDAKIPGHNSVPFVKDGSAWHSAELWYVFGTLDRCWRPFDEKHHKLSDMIVDYWTNFAKNGDPNGPTVPEWHAYSRLDEEQTYATNILTENGSEIKALIDDDVWALVAFNLFPPK